jgi:hypothetical protein
MREKLFFSKENPKTRKNRIFLGSIRTAFNIALLAVFISGCTHELEKDQSGIDPALSTVIAEIYPADRADTVVINPVVEVTLANSVTPAEVLASTLTLKSGSIAVPGTVLHSGKKAKFIPSTELKPDTKYTATFKTNADGGSGKEHSWSFTTGKKRLENALSIVSVSPENNSTGVALTVQPVITFSDKMESSKIKLLKITLKTGTTEVKGSLTYSGKTATFIPTSALAANALYTATVSSVSKGDDDDEGEEDDHEYKPENTYTWSFTTGGGGTDVTAPTVLSVVPAVSATSVAVNGNVNATFSEAMNASTITPTTFTLKQGATTVAGSVSYSGTTATFNPTADLAGGTVYTATITTGARDVAGNALAAIKTWSFTTASGADITAPTVLSIVPAGNATSVAVNGNVTATFSEAMNASTITSTTFTLKQGATTVAGTVSYSGTTATFNPTADLAGGTVYTATITTGAKDLAGNALAAIKTWSFTTASGADVTAPTVLSVVPAVSATSVAVNGNVTATFSEAMNASTITSATFTLKQGATTVAGTVSYSGTTATFNPTADLAGGTVYTATITTGAQDVAGNALAAVKTWSFTTVTVAPVVSFSTQVMPILQNRCTVCHGAISPTAGISITNFATVSKLSNTQLDNSNMYPKMGTTPAEIATIRAWIAAGRPNN